MVFSQPDGVIAKVFGKFDLLDVLTVQLRIRFPPTRRILKRHHKAKSHNGPPLVSTSSHQGSHKGECSALSRNVRTRLPFSCASRPRRLWKNRSKRRCSMRVGFIGLGNMAAPMASHVLAPGHSMTVYDTRKEA